MVKQEHWGYHLIVNIAKCNDNILHRETLKAWLDELLPTIEMVPYKDPLIEHFAEHLPEAAGYTLIQMIETSAITGHFSDLNKDAYLDIFSCKPFDPNEALEIIRKHFEPKEVQILFLPREAKTPPHIPFTETVEGTTLDGYCNGCGICCCGDTYTLRKKDIAAWFDMHGYKHPFGSEHLAQVMVTKIAPDEVKLTFFDRCENLDESLTKNEETGDMMHLCKIHNKRPEKCRNFPQSQDQIFFIPKCSYRK